MSEPKKIIILGVGGNCIDILDTINDINESLRELPYVVKGFLDDDETKWGKDIQGIKVLGGLETAHKYPDNFFINGIVSPSYFYKKEDLIAKTHLSIEKFETIVHPSAHVSKLSQLGQGTVVFQHVTVNSGVKIGHHVMVLPNSVISHDCIIDDYATIASGVCVSGNVKIGRSCYIGSNSSIKENVVIHDNSLIGMGSVVLNDVPEKSIFAGLPAKFIRPIDQGKKGGE